MHKLSEFQRRELLKNPNVKKITKNHVQFTSQFQLNALSKYVNGISPTEIFKEANIDPKLFKDKYCNSCLKRWKKKHDEQGVDGFKDENRGQGKRSRKPTYEELEAIIAIQREVLGYAKD